MLNETGKILIVDDDELLAEVATEYLLGEGFQVSSVSNGAQAIDAIAREKPDLVLMDIQMPVLDGFKTTERLRQSFDFDELPIVMMTALDDMESVSRAYDVGATDFIAKPINWLVLVQRLRYVLRMVQTLKVEQQLKQELRSAQKNRTIAMMVNGLAHDFNNQLQVIGSTAELLGMNGSLLASGSADIERIHKSVKHGQHLIEQLFSFGSSLSSTARSLDLNEEIIRIEQLLRSSIPEAVCVELNLEPDLDPIYASHLEIDHVLVTLVLTAGEAMPEGGKLVITTRNSIPGPMGKKSVAVIVADTGKGLTPEMLEQIDKPAHLSNNCGECDNLGLSMLRETLEKLQGNLLCRSQMNVGTEFTISLPSISSAKI